MNRVVAALLALALVLGSVAVGAAFLLGGDDDAPASSGPPPERPIQTEAPASTAATKAPSPELEQFYSQDVAWSPCGNGFECGWLKVPMDYDQTEAESLDLALVKVLAGNPEQRIGSLVVNPGGPGAPGTQYAAQASLVFRSPVVEHFDIVGFDPRGTGRSNPVDCLTDDELDDYMASDPDPDDKAEEAEFVGWVMQLGEGCKAKSGALADHVSTVEAAKDMDVLRAALGETELDFFGASYGTKLGATYAELFPERVGHFVLDGAVDSTLTAREMSLGQARGFETAITAYVEDCVASGSCFLGDTVEEGLEGVRAFIDQVDAEPLPAGDRELQVGNAFYGIAAPLYNKSYWPLLTRGLKQAMDGDGTALMDLADLYSSRGPNGYTDNSSEAIYAINCLDDPSSIPVSQVPDEFAAFDEASPTFGRIFAWGLTGCLGFDHAEPEPLEIDGAGAAPILVTGTTRDPATPYEWAEALASQLESGILVSRDGDGHTAYNSGNACVDETIEDYLIDGKVPTGTVTC